MNIQMVGCTHHRSSVSVRERLAFSKSQTEEALDGWRKQFPGTEAVLISTCNRVELYTAAQDAEHGPSHEIVAEFLAGFHELSVNDVLSQLFEQSGEDAIRHLFMVAASLDSMVVGESQILAQVKQAYELANQQQSTGPLTHSIFQTAVRVARRVATETSINERRVSIPSVAVADFASQIFQNFGDKNVLVFGAGEMASETLRYLQMEGARSFTVVNRNQRTADELADRWQGHSHPWERRHEALIDADLVITATSSREPIVSLDDFRTRVEPERHQRPLFVLDLAIPRDFDPSIGERVGVYLYSIDDLTKTCERNRAERTKELPAAMRIVDEETQRFMSEFYHRATAPIITRLREGWQKPKESELQRLFDKLPQLDDKSLRREISIAFERLINKLLHPPLESLKDESRHGPPHRLLDALKRLFQLKD